MLAAYLHDLNPVALRLSVALVLRWYGLAYVAGLVVAWGIVWLLARRGLSEIAPREVALFMLLFAFIAVMVGGRLGHWVGYHLPDGGAAAGQWRSGMSSHGCVLGTVILCLGYARWRKISWLGLLDTLVCAGTPGVFFVRLGNFINGEYLGRVTSVPWAVKFPTEMRSADFVPANGDMLAAGLPLEARWSPEIIAFYERSGLDRERLAAWLHPLHPVQLYEAVWGGLLLFVVLIALRFKFPHLRHGVLAGLACCGYAVARIVIEAFRLPEPGEALLAGLTRGQAYSAIMLLCGLAVLGVSRRATT